MGKSGSREVGNYWDDLVGDDNHNMNTSPQPQTQTNFPQDVAEIQPFFDVDHHAQDSSEASSSGSYPIFWDPDFPQPCPPVTPCDPLCGNDLIESCLYMIIEDCVKGVAIGRYLANKGTQLIQAYQRKRNGRLTTLSAADFLRRKLGKDKGKGDDYGKGISKGTKTKGVIRSEPKV